MNQKLNIDPFEFLEQLEKLKDSNLGDLLKLVSHESKSKPSGEDLYGYLLGALETEASEPMQPTSFSSEDRTTELLKQIQIAVATHPAAAKWIVSTLREEGRRYASTAEGAALAKDLANSDLVRKARMVWENSTLWLLNEDSSGALPSQYVDAIFAAASRVDLEPYLDRMFTRESG